MDTEISNLGRHAPPVQSSGIGADLAQRRHLVDSSTTLFVDGEGRWQMLSCIAPAANARIKVINDSGAYTDLGPASGPIDINVLYPALRELCKSQTRSKRFVLMGGELPAPASGMKNFPFWFYLQVKTGGPWDLKNRKDLIYGTSAYYGSTFKYKGQLMDAAFVGNHFVASMARYFLIPFEILLRFSGWYQIYMGTSPLRCRKPLLSGKPNECIGPEPLDRPGKKVKVQSRSKPDQFIDSLFDPNYGEDPPDLEAMRLGYWDS